MLRGLSKFWSLGLEVVERRVWGRVPLWGLDSSGRLWVSHEKLGLHTVPGTWLQVSVRFSSCGHGRFQIIITHGR